MAKIIVHILRDNVKKQPFSGRLLANWLRLSGGAYLAIPPWRDHCRGIWKFSRRFYQEELVGKARWRCAA